MNRPYLQWWKDLHRTAEVGEDSREEVARTVSECLRGEKVWPSSISTPSQGKWGVHSFGGFPCWKRRGSFASEYLVGSIWLVYGSLINNYSFSDSGSRKEKGNEAEGRSKGEGRFGARMLVRGCPGKIDVNIKRMTHIRISSWNLDHYSGKGMMGWISGPVTL